MFQVVSACLKTQTCCKRWLATQYKPKVLRDHIALFTPEILGQANQIVANVRCLLVKKEESICARAESLVVTTNVHFPTDISLLSDLSEQTTPVPNETIFVLRKRGNRSQQHIAAKNISGTDDVLSDRYADKALPQPDSQNRAGVTDQVSWHQRKKAPEGGNQ